jgi:serine/threonine-protein kinase
MGEVYLAQDTKLARKVALKLLPHSLTADARLRARFFREAQLASALDHPNVCTIHEVGESSTFLFIAMQYIEGVNLKQIIRSQSLKLDALLSISLQAADALAAAHDLGIIHRDIKSDNIIVTPKGQAKVLDFGLAKLINSLGSTDIAGAESDSASQLTRTGVVMGTPNYMSPEQARGENIDHRSDIFSLGVVIYEMACGSLPFKRRSQTETMNAVINEVHTPVAEFNHEIPAELSAAIDRALSKEPADRYQSMGELLSDLCQVGRAVGLLGTGDSHRGAVIPYVALSSTQEVTRMADGDYQGAVVPYQSLRRRSGKRRVWAMTLLVLALVVGLGLWFSYLRPLTPEGPARIQSLAVLPMVSSDSSQDYLADGMTEALIADLAKISALQGISRFAVVRYRGGQKPVPEITRDLKVDAALAGSVFRFGERVQISIQLIHGETNRIVWADSYERDLRDVLALQRYVARDIADEIKIKLSPQEQEQLVSTHPVNPEAYDHYLRGRYYANRQTRDDNETAINSLERAVRLDSTFASAHAELAQAYVWKLYLFAPLERQLAEKAFMATEKALSLDPDSAVAHLARGRLLWTPANRFPHETAIREYRRALALNPNLDEARNQLALVYCHIGAFDEALQESQRAVMANPSNNLAQFRTAQTLNFQGKYSEALSVLRALPKEVNPALVGQQTAWALFNLGRTEEVADTIDQFIREYPEDSGGLLTSIEAVLAASVGQQHKSEEKIKLAIRRGKGFGHFHHTAYHLACAYALMNKPDDAIKWLEAAAEDGFPCYPLFERDRNLDSLRHNAHFVRFMTSLRQQWEDYKTKL